MEKFYSNGKLLITGEYAVLDGARALAVPTKFGQFLEVIPTNDGNIHWTSIDEKKEVWLEARLNIQRQIINADEPNTNDPVLQKLIEIIKYAHSKNPNVLANSTGFQVTTTLDFPRNWGLGTSSTLINNIAQWFEIDAYELLENTFGGSGYDIAAAQNNSAIIYQKSAGAKRAFTADFKPPFTEELFFVHLNKKQNSRKSINHYRSRSKTDTALLTEKISALTEAFLTCDNIKEFRMLMEIHETLISKAVGLPKIKKLHFPNYPGGIKSLGGWGGDFILATGGDAEKDYFRSKNYNTIIPFSEMVR